MISIAADAAANGDPINLEEPSEALVNGYSTVFVPVRADAYREHFGFAIWYYGGIDFPAQVVWPSKEGLYPWYPKASVGFKAAQPVLGHYAGGT